MPSASFVVVEDSPPYAKLVEVLIAQAVPEPVEVRHHSTLAAAVADLREREADVVLLDLGLPDAHGLEALATLLAAGVRAPIVVLSGHDDEELAVNAIAAGAQDYLVKGDERRSERFARTLRFAIARRRAQERSEDLLRAREDRWRTLTHLAPVGIVELSADGGCIFANDWVGRLAGMPAEALLGQGWRRAIPARDFELLAEQAVPALGEDGDGTISRELRTVRPDGETVWAQLTAVVLRDPWGTPAGWLATLVDVTPAHRAREELARAEQELQHQQEDVLAIAARAREASIAADAPAELLAGGGTVLAADFAVLLVPDGDGRLRVDAVDGAELPAGLEVDLDDAEPSGAARSFRSGERVEVAGAAADDAVSQATGGRTVVFEPLVHGTDVVGVVAIGWRDVVGDLNARTSTVARLLAAELATAVERRRLLRQLQDLARTDPLTGLANRRLWDERIDVELARAERYQRPLCVAMLDLDRFKAYNDTRGHQAGDRLLRELAAAWRGVVRGADLLARLGGDEFAVMLPDCDEERARPILERLRRLTEASGADVGCSAGVARWRLGESAAELLARADEALYATKAAGGGGVSLG